MQELKKGYFLPYQEAWIQDESMLKIWEKTRRGGMTYVESYVCTKEAAMGKWDVWFSSADDTAAREFIRYCEQWAKLFKEAAKALNETIFDDERKAVQVYSITFKSGKRINALSSNPSQFRSKGGKVVLDEFAFHKDAEGMWAAAEPVTTWGFPLVILSSHNGKSSKFYKLIQEAKAGKLKATVHRTDILEAINQGLLDKIYKRKVTEDEKLQWVNDKKGRLGTNRFNEEYLAIPNDETGAFLSYALIEANQSDKTLYSSLDELKNPFFVGCDIARRKNLFVIWVAEQVGDVLYTRFVEEHQNIKFSAMKSALYKYIEHPKHIRTCIDKTGMGEQLTEETIEKFGASRVEGILFSNAVKGVMAGDLSLALEDKSFIIPDSDAIKEDFHSVRKVVTIAGNTRIEADVNPDDQSHADRFWAAALCKHAQGKKSTGFNASHIKSLTELINFLYPNRNELLSKAN